MTLLHNLQRTCNPRHVVGCGSNVVDIFHKVESLPLAGQKGFFQNPTEPISAKLVGGVTLNHLCWARLLGAPTSLLALEDDAEHGILIRNKLKELDIDTQKIDISSTYCTSVSHIFLDANGERCIMMAPGSTSLISKDIVNDIFSAHFQDKNTCLFSTEISQVPLNCVIAMLNLCQKYGIPSIIDVDVPPSVAISDANLGNMDEIFESLSKSTIIKPTLEAEIQLLQINMNEKDVANMAMEGLRDISKELKSRFKDSKFIAITNGKKGAVILNNDEIVEIEPLPNIQQIDSTGAGDAFFGGIIAGIYHYGMPETYQELERIGNIAKCAGAACVEILGALPILTDRHSENRLLQLNASLIDMIKANPIPNIAMEYAVSSAMSSILTDCETLTELFNMNEFEQQINGLVAEILKVDKIFVSGIGKSGIMAQRMAASLSSIGYPAEYVNGSEWVHGDFGKLKLKDNNSKSVLIAFSSSGRTMELYAAIKWIAKERVCVDNANIFGVFCINKEDVKQYGTSDNWMGHIVDNVIYLGNHEKKEVMGCVPSRSIIVQEAFINAVITVLHDGQQKETMDEFKVNHPGGNIGQILKLN